MNLPGGLIAGAFAMPSEAELPGLLATVADAHPELTLSTGQPFARPAILADFGRACRFISQLYEAPAVDTEKSARDWAREANAWSYDNGLGSATISADVFTAAAIALAATSQTTNGETFFNLSNGWPYTLPTPGAPMAL
ncbi:MAG: hypothetical protein KGJ66_04220 [Alphaproteobacteria bacterium]|nr:hypothetical protein [Alphaproteobacteria bacterium]